MNLSIDKTSLLNYVRKQLEIFFPDQNKICLSSSSIDEALNRLHTCINSVKLWRKDYFNHLHSTQYCIFLYFLSRCLYEESSKDVSTCNKIFMLNKMLNGIDLFYEIKMPSKFFIGHSVGIVLAKAKYEDYLVLYQNSTVGQNNGHSPALGAGTILYPNSAILGQSKTGSYTTVSQGARLIDDSTCENTIVFNGIEGPKFKKAKRKYIDDYFRL